MYRKKEEGWLKHWDFFMLDLFSLQLSFYISSYVILKLKNVAFFDMYRNQAMILILCVFMYSYLAEPYKGILHRSARQEIRAMAAGTFYMVVLNLAFLFFVHIAQHMSRKVFVLCWGLYFSMALLLRLLLKKLVMHIRGGAIGARSVLLITEPEYLDKVSHELSALPMSGFFISGVFLTHPLPEETSRILGAPVLGSCEQAGDYAGHHWVDEVFIRLQEGSDWSNLLRNEFLEMGIPVHEYLGQVHPLDDDSDTRLIESYGSLIFVTTVVRRGVTGRLIKKRRRHPAGGLEEK